MRRLHARIRRIAALKLRLRCKRGQSFSISVQSGLRDGFWRGHSDEAVGTIGYEGRIDYTANENVVNLASRLCCGVDDTPMLVDAVVAKRVKQSIAPVSFGERTIKGYDHPLQVFAVERSEVAIRYLDCGWRLP